MVSSLKLELTRRALSLITERETKGLQDIVGQEWVSTSPCMMDTYSLYMNPETVVKDGSKWLPRPVAVVLPKSTQEVQEIMRFCNKNHLMTKPLSTGFHAVCAASRDRVIILDLKRMNRIIDIDAKNQVAIVEPYVRAIDLQTEIFKLGLTVHTVSSGSNHSLLASTTAAWGYGSSGPATSYSGRNLLGVEWVLPTGEVLTLGSGGVGTGWFTADGPGPSLRGIMRGFQGTFGGLGVFTKCAVKLYKWNGPAQWKVHGKSPVYVLDKLPERMTMNVHAFPTAEAMADAGYKLGEAEIEFACFRTPLFFSALGMTENNEELKVAMESGFFDKSMHHVLVNAVIGHSDGEFKWKMAAMKQIMRETGGVKSAHEHQDDASNVPRHEACIETHQRPAHYPTPLPSPAGRDPQHSPRKTSEVAARLPVILAVDQERRQHTGDLPSFSGDVDDVRFVRYLGYGYHAIGMGRSGEEEVYRKGDLPRRWR